MLTRRPRLFVPSFWQSAKPRLSSTNAHRPTEARGSGDSAKGLTRLGVLAEPMLYARMDFQDAIGAGLGVTEFARGGRAAQETEALWSWTRAQFESARCETSADKPALRRAAA